jgi:hypothetical protein
MDDHGSSAHHLPSKGILTKRIMALNLSISSTACFSCQQLLLEGSRTDGEIPESASPFLRRASLHKRKRFIKDFEDCICLFLGNVQ